MSKPKQGDPWTGFLALMVIVLSAMYVWQVIFR